MISLDQIIAFLKALSPLALFAFVEALLYQRNRAEFKAADNELKQKEAEAKNEVDAEFAGKSDSAIVDELLKPYDDPTLPKPK